MRAFAVVAHFLKCCSNSDVLLEKQCLARRKKSQKREHVSNSNLCNNGKAF